MQVGSQDEEEEDPAQKTEQSSARVGGEPRVWGPRNHVKKLAVCGWRLVLLRMGSSLLDLAS